MTFNDTSTAGGTDYTWSFGDGTPDVSGTATQVSHTYEDAGAFTVSLTVTYTAPAPTASVTKTAFITVNLGYCSVPSLITNGSTTPTSSGRTTYHFTGTVERADRRPGGAKDFKILSQSIVGGTMVPCDSDIFVSKP